MLKQGTLANKKYYSMLLFNFLTFATYTINTMVDAILGGNQLGEVALQAVSIVAPLYSVCCFFAYIFTPGCGILFGLSIGEFRKEDASRAAGTSIVSSAVIGITTAFLLFIIKVPFLKYYGCTGDLLEAASSYYNWYIGIALVFPIANAVYFLIAVEGAAFYMMIGSIGSVSTNMILSYVLCNIIGVSGLGMATFISKVFVTLIYCLAFLNKKYRMHFTLSIDKGILKRAAVLSANTALNYIFVAIVDIIMNKVIILACGQPYIAAYSVINLMLSLFMVTDGNYYSCQGIVTSYIGEKNNGGVYRILRTAMKSICVICAVMMVLLFFTAPLMPKIFGITTPALVDASIRATRILAISIIPFGVAYFAYDLYTSLNRPVLSIVMAFLNNFFCPLILSIPLAFIMGFDGISVGMSASSFLVVVLFAYFVRKRYGNEGFPLYLEDSGEEAWSCDLKVSKETIPEIRDMVKAEFDKHGYEIENLEILIEELYTRIYEKNPGKTVYSECALLFGPNHVRIIVRDNGVIFNFVDENNAVESMNAYVLNSLLERTKDKEYLITTSLNRNGFVFEKE